MVRPPYLWPMLPFLGGGYKRRPPSLPVVLAAIQLISLFFKQPDYSIRPLYHREDAGLY